MFDDIFGSGILHPPRATAAGDLALSKGSDRLIEAAEKILSTPRGSCPLDPNFGLEIDAYDVVQDVSELAWAMTRAVEYGEPRAGKIKALIEEVDAENGYVLIRLEITPRGGITPVTRTFPFYRKS